MNFALFIAVIISVLVFFLTSIAVFVTRKRNYRNAPIVLSTATHSASGNYDAGTTLAYQTPGNSSPYLTQGIPIHKQVPAASIRAADGHLNAPASHAMAAAASMNDAAVNKAIVNEKQSNEAI